VDPARFDLVPEAGGAARVAVRRAVDAVAADEQRRTASYHGEWRRTALAEGVDRDPGYAPPRSSLGATRA